MDARLPRIWLGCCLLLTTSSCDRHSGFVSEAQSQSESAASAPASAAPDGAPRTEPIDLLEKSDFDRTYPWEAPSETWPRAATLEQRFRTPAGFERIHLAPDTWGAFLRELPLRLDRTTVLTHDRERVAAPAAAVALLPVGRRNLQQCADAILRLRAEWLWGRGASERISFHFTSGDRSRWTDWAAGERFRIDGADVERHRSAAPETSRSNFVDYLQHLFMYAGTRSLPLDTHSVPADGEIRPGDVFVDPGSPGHAVLVLDVAVDASGERIALLGQSFMPAQEFHVLESPDAIEGVWFSLPAVEDATLHTPSWSPFSRDQARRFPDTPLD